jgi:hypothetical protein
MREWIYFESFVMAAQGTLYLEESLSQGYDVSSQLAITGPKVEGRSHNPRKQAATRARNLEKAEKHILS